ncbi:release factor glutamine methyltransferase [Geomicrobium halophilum]|uniref:Release factor glutamine methyltransferase n=1 Tax=Geomicrobium halophilum TaxID=549000 RepID=A0A841PNR7_9BACL|nr:peptide chain release factor N(5)-glutamine methyltransferase [Geomicrobium halophilum]MBB6450477.1 release factor glutamine methyltransferase [Geomicrobium halophilum]
MTEPPRVYEALHWASSFLKQRDLESKAAEHLMQNVLQLEGVHYQLHLRERLNEEEWGQFKEMVDRHGQEEPIQYITGMASFYGRHFNVDPAVLIPRQETEELVLLILEKAKKRFQRPIIADIATGSGAIAVTLALEWLEAEVWATDISADAITVAKENASQLHAPSITFLEGNMATPLRENGKVVDVLVSNPPYIATRDWKGLAPLVRDYEPRQALDAGGDGLHFYRQLAMDLPYVLADNGLAFFEIGDTQGPAVVLLMEQQLPDATVNIVKDINGRDRIVTVER